MHTYIHTCVLTFLPTYLYIYTFQSVYKHLAQDLRANAERSGAQRHPRRGRVFVQRPYAHEVPACILVVATKVL